MPALIFDFDGVVIDSEELHFRAYSAVLAEFGAEVDRPTYGRIFIARGNGAEWAVSEFGLPIDAEEVKARKQPIYRRILEAEARLMPAAAKALARLAESFPLALATNSGEREVLPVLEQLDVRRYFAQVICRERYAKAKPAPDAFLAAALALDLPPAECVVVEDAEKGVRAAAAAGTPCVAVPNDLTRDHDFATARRVLGGLDELTAELVLEILSADDA